MGIYGVKDYNVFLGNCNVQSCSFPEYHKRVKLYEWIVMPNHVYCVIVLGDYGFDNRGFW